jgi:hypothetical protein
MLKAPPGTELYTKMRNAGRLIEPFDFSENESNIIPVVDPEVLMQGFDFVLRHVYSPQGVYARTRTFLEGYPGAKVAMPIRRPMNLKGFYMFARATWMLGIVSADRRYFWSLMLWTLRHRRNVLSVSFLGAVLSYQFKRMYESFDAKASATRMTKAIVGMPARPDFADASAGVGDEASGSVVEKRA